MDIRKIGFSKANAKNKKKKSIRQCYFLLFLGTQMFNKEKKNPSTPGVVATVQTARGSSSGWKIQLV